MCVTTPGNWLRAVRPGGTEFGRIVTSLLRRSPRISGLLMRLVGGRFEQGRHPFLADVAHRTRERLSPGGSRLTGISEEEAKALSILPGLRLHKRKPIPSMPRQEVFEFRFHD